MSASTGVMEPAAEASPRFNARVAGLCYLLTFLTGIVAVMIAGRLLVPGDAAATATSILAHPGWYQLGFTAYLVNVVAYLAVTQLFYGLFKPVNRGLAQLAVLFSLVGCAVQASASLLDLAPLVVLRGEPYLGVFQPEQQQALALLCLKLHGQAFNIGLVFFAFYCLLTGILVFRSTFLPRALGVLMMLAGLSWMTFLSPPLASALSPYNLAPGVLGEGALTLWLLVRGVNVQRWQAMARAVASAH